VIADTSAWWLDAVIYQVYPRSFRDSNNDGAGDLAGVIQGLPYLSSLGVDAIWLSPFFKTPNKDGGYDVADPRDVDPLFGTLSDAENLITHAHGFGIKVIFDIVPNHFSSEHIWFQAALASEPGSKERARFHFADGKGANGDTPPNNWESLFNGAAWSRVIEKDGKPGQWYLHLFDSSQPDLNWHNPEVQEDFEKTIRFWLDRGLDGFRIDVAHGMFKSDITQDHRDPKALTRALRVDLGGMDFEVRKALLSDIPFLGNLRAMRSIESGARFLIHTSKSGWLLQKHIYIRQRGLPIMFAQMSFNKYLTLITWVLIGMLQKSAKQ